jgi:hypothetical protein
LYQVNIISIRRRRNVVALRQQTLQKYVSLAKTILIDVAKGKRKRKYITYKELMDEMHGPGRAHIGEVLEEVSCNEASENRPLLSAIVIHKSDRLPGDGFWKIGIIRENLERASQTERDAFWQEQCNKVWTYWQRFGS